MPILENPQVRAPIAVSFGAIAGALCRYYGGQWLTTTWATEFPIGTFWVNLSGCFLMGFVSTLGLHQARVKPELFLLLSTGFLGSYTTFSTYALDTADLLDQQSINLALLYGLGSPLLGLVSLGLGIGLATVLVSGPPPKP